MGEIQALVLRAQAGGQPERPPIDLEIKIGSINRPLSVDHGLSFAYGREESKFIEAAEQRANQRRNDPMSTILGSVPDAQFGNSEKVRARHYTDPTNPSDVRNRTQELHAEAGISKPKKTRKSTQRLRTL